jgi:hypothetical protein
MFNSIIEFRNRPNLPASYPSVHHFKYYYRFALNHNSMRKSILLFFLSIAMMAATAQMKEAVGIGVRLQIDSSRGYKLPLIIAIVPNGPAEAAGLQAGDFIMMVDGQTTRDIELKNVIAMIVGKEGTEVKLVLERKGAKRSYTITRQMYKYSNAYYQSAVKDNDFCTALVTLMNDAAYNFQNMIDTLHFTEGKAKFSPTYYNCKAKIPAANKVSIASSFGGYTAVINFGSFKTTAEVNANGTPVIATLKTCFPDYYFTPFVDDKGNVIVQIGRETKDGFESNILTLTSYLDDELQAYQLNLNVNGGKNESILYH